MSTEPASDCAASGCREMFNVSKNVDCTSTRKVPQEICLSNECNKSRTVHFQAHFYLSHANNNCFHSGLTKFRHETFEVLKQ